MNERTLTWSEADRIRAALFDGRAGRLFALADGARSPRVHHLLLEGGAPFACLYDGPLAPPLERAAPYLVALERDAPLTIDLIAHGWGRAWGVYLETGVTLEDLRAHLRSLLRVTDSRGRRLLFRFYDPRVLRVYLPTCTDGEARRLFGPIDRFLVEDETPGLLDFTPSAIAPPRRIS